MNLRNGDNITQADTKVLADDFVDLDVGVGAFLIDQRDAHG